MYTSLALNLQRSFFLFLLNVEINSVCHNYPWQKLTSKLPGRIVVSSFSLDEIAPPYLLGIEMPAPMMNSIGQKVNKYLLIFSSGEISKSPPGVL